MKYVFYLLITIAVGLMVYGIIYKDETLVLNVDDTYFVISYKHFGILIGVIVLGIAGLIFLFKKVIRA